jgi:hypothetical protein
MENHSDQFSNHMNPKPQARPARVRTGWEYQYTGNLWRLAKKGRPQACIPPIKNKYESYAMNVGFLRMIKENRP